MRPQDRTGGRRRRLAVHAAGRAASGRAGACLDCGGPAGAAVADDAAGPSVGGGYARCKPARTVAASLLTGLLLGGAGLLPVRLHAQEGCQFGDEGNDALDRQTLSGGATITYVSNPHFVCADGVRIWADSAVAYSAQGMSHLMGAVRYLDPTRELRADEARYFSRQERVQANGHLYVRDVADGSVIENGELVYLRRADFRDEESMTVTTGADGVRPVARIRPAAPDSAAEAATDPGAAGRASDSAGATAWSPSDSAGASAAPPSAGEPREPYVVVADRIFLQGEARFEASGRVEIERDSMLAFADSAEYDRVGDRILLRGSARVEGPTYDLRGQTIDLLTPEGATSEVHAIRDAVLTGEDLVISSSRIRLYLTDGALDRLVATPLPEDTATAVQPPGAGGAAPPALEPNGVPEAVPGMGGEGSRVRIPGAAGDGARPEATGRVPSAEEAVAMLDSALAVGEGAPDPFAVASYPGQPVALVEEFRLTADSIDVLAPGERIERIFAAGRARSVSHARDSLNVEGLPAVARADWLEGDTVIVYFEPEAPDPATGAALEQEAPGPQAADSAEARYRVERIRALVDARSLYRLAPADSAARAGVDPPAVHYVVGDSITVLMDGDEVERMEVVGKTQGIHLEPLSGRRAAPDSLSDSTAVPDTGTARVPSAVPDTGAVRAPTTAGDRPSVRDAPPARGTAPAGGGALRAGRADARQGGRSTSTKVRSGGSREDAPKAGTRAVRRAELARWWPPPRTRTASPTHPPRRRA